MKSFVIITFFLLGCIAFNQALKCYSHDPCSSNCPQLYDTIKTCESGNDRCYKAAFPGGVSRGCARDRCNVQFNANSVMANVCCENDLCNSGITTKMTFTSILMTLATFLFARM